MKGKELKEGEVREERWDEMWGRSDEVWDEKEEEEGGRIITDFWVKVIDLKKTIIKLKVQVYV